MKIGLLNTPAYLEVGLFFETYLVDTHINMYTLRKKEIKNDVIDVIK